MQKAQYEVKSLLNSPTHLFIVSGINRVEPWTLNHARRWQVDMQRQCFAVQPRFNPLQCTPPQLFKPPTVNSHAREGEARSHWPLLYFPRGTNRPDQEAVKETNVRLAFTKMEDGRLEPAKLQ